MKTVAAIVAAVAMVMAAVIIRNRIDESRNTDGDAHLVCATELEQACSALDDAVGGLDVTVEPAGATFVRLTALPDTDADDPGLDGWLAPGPWPQMVDVLREQQQLQPLFETSGTTLARSPLVIAIRQDRARVLEDGACAGTIGWACLGDAAGRSWEDLGGDFPGALKVGNTDPTTSASGLVVLAQAASQFFGTTEYALADLQTDDFRAWLSRLESAGTSPSPIDEMLSAYPTTVYDAAGATEATAGPTLANAAPDRRNAFTLIYPEPVATADVVLTLVATDERDQDIAELAGGGRARQELGESGWRAEGVEPVPGVRERVRLPAEANLPTDPGVYIALQGAWKQVAG